MRITKTQLMQIIKEELSEAVVGASASRGVPPKEVLKRATTAYGKIQNLLEELMGGIDKYEEHPTAEDDMKDIYNAFIQLDAYIKNQEASKESMNEAKLKDFIKTGKINTSIPAGSLMKVLGKKPELAMAYKKGFSSDDAGERKAAKDAFKEISRLLAADADIMRAIGDEDLDKHLDVKGFLRYAAMNMRHLFS